MKWEKSLICILWVESMNIVANRPNPNKHSFVFIPLRATAWVFENSRYMTENIFFHKAGSVVYAPRLLSFWYVWHIARLEALSLNATSFLIWCSICSQWSVSWGCCSVWTGWLTPWLQCWSVFLGKLWTENFIFSHENC